MVESSKAAAKNLESGENRSFSTPSPKPKEWAKQSPVATLQTRTLSSSIPDAMTLESGENASVFIFLIWKFELPARTAMNFEFIEKMTSWIRFFR
ncbi:hypothetical protein NW762_014356 [Fusarium torreyae]|uniref:Uncharacterized protein n=1 Tax=Fusarium torreyae TaxID=1237075 RepID=A0A9W8RMD4_9HYPO|nr:hypothetical protein NW762_014356 [Fusarium torreyae]